MKYNRNILGSALMTGLFFLLSISSYSQIASGTYTIGGTSPDYADFTAAVDDLNINGLAGDGPVIFNIRNGTYTENVTINQITNASLTSNITFKSENNDSTLVTLTHSTADATLAMDGADYITFSLITIQTTGSKKVIELYGGASNNKFLNCCLNGYSTTSTANTYAVVYSHETATKENNNEFRNNVITNGSWGFNYLGDINYYETGTVITGNEFIDQSGRAIYMSYQDGVEINNNTITSNRNTEWYGMYLNYCKNASKIKNNKIWKTTAGRGYGIYLNQCKATIGNRSEVSNNFVQMIGTSGTGYGIYSNYADYIDFYFNNVSSSHTTTSHSAFRTAGGEDGTGTIRIKNNIFVNTGGGYAVYVSTTTGIDEIDYNDYYATGSDLGKWGSIDKPDLAAWILSTGETNSLNLDPSYTDAPNGDLHIGNSSLEGQGVYISSITADFDRTARSDPPTIGAHEIVSVTGPTIIVVGSLSTYETFAGTPTSEQTFTVEGINLTNDISITAPANFEIQEQGVGPWGSNVTLTQSGGSVALTIIEARYNPGSAGWHNEIITCESTGAVTKNVAIKGISTYCSQPFSGVYTIDGSIPASCTNYQTITDAVSDMVNGIRNDDNNYVNGPGIDGAIYFDIASGTYNEQIKIENISGAYDSIFFQSASGNYNDVVIEYSCPQNGDINNYVLRLDGSQFVTIRNITVQSLGGSTYTKVIDITGDATDNTITNNNLIGQVTTSQSNDRKAVVASSSDFNNNNNEVSNNIITDGSHGIFVKGKAFNNFESGVIISGNNIINSEFTGIYLENHDAPEVRYNSITTTSDRTDYIGIYAGYNDNGLKIQKNQIYSSTACGYGIYLYNCDGNSGTYGETSNNMVYIGTGGDVTNYGIQLNQSDYQKVYYNSAASYSSRTINSGELNCAFKSMNTCNNQIIKNNIFVNADAGLAIHIDIAASIEELDYNDLYTETGAYLGRWVSTSSADATLASWQAVTPGNEDDNSISDDPLFNSITDLHIQTGSPVIDKADPLTDVTDDIDDESRNPPDIGADEYAGAPLPLSLDTIVSTDITCYSSDNGSINITISGGVPPIEFSVDSGATFQSSGTFNNLLPGDYDVIVADANNDTLNAGAVTILEPPEITYSTSVVDAGCGQADGSATVTPAGGTPNSGINPYSYAWNTAPVQTDSIATSLEPGTYNVVITDANGCTQTAGLSVSSPGGAVNIIEVNNLLCNGDTSGYAVAQIIGGVSGSYTYQWNTVPPLASPIREIITFETTDTLLNIGAGNYTIITIDSICTDSSSFTISEPAILSIDSVAANDITCYGYNDGIITILSSGGTAPIEYSIDSGVTYINTGTFSNLTSDTYNIFIKDSNNCVVSGSQVIISDPTEITFTFSVTDAACGDTNGTATVTPAGGIPASGENPYTYQWNTTPVQSDSTATDIAAGVYTVEITDGAGCIDSATVTVSNTGGGVVSIIDTINVLCNGDSTGSAIAHITGGVSGTYTYQWNTSPPQPLPIYENTTTDTTDIFSNLGAGNYIVTVLDSVCISSAEFTISQPNEIIIDSLIVTDVACPGDINGIISIIMSGGLPPIEYSIDGGATFQGSEVFMNLEAGNYNIFIRDSNNCIFKDSIATVSNPSDIIYSTSVTNAACGDTNGTATITPSGGTPDTGEHPYIYQWGTSPVQTDSIATGLAAGIYYVIITDGNGCVDSATVTISDSSGAAVSIIDSLNALCYGDTSGYAIAEITSGISGIYTYQWNTMPPLPDPIREITTSETTDTLSNIGAGNYIVTVLDSVCSSSDEFAITEPPVLNIDTVVINDVTCSGYNNGVITIIGSGGTLPLEYSTNGGATFESTGIYDSLSPANYEIVVMDVNNCMVEGDTIDISTLYNLPELELGNDTAICSGTNTMLDAGSGFVSYLWTTGETTQEIDISQSGLYYVSVTDTNSCSAGSDTINITVTVEVNTEIIADGDTIFCEGINIGLDAGAGYTHYQWSTNDTLQFVSIDLGGIYSVTVSDENDCQGYDSIVLEMISTPVADVSPTDIAVCLNESVQLDASGGDNYLWLPSDNLDNPAIANPISTPVENITYMVIVSNENCPGDTAYSSISVNQLPIVDLGEDHSITEGESVTLIASGGATYYWYPDEDLTCSNCQTPDATPEDTITYYVTVTDLNNCTGIDSITINVAELNTELFIPNTFTPNGDDVNDTWVIRNIYRYPDCDINIFNRWGDNVYSTNGYSNDWDGIDLPSGTYYYVIDLKDDKDPRIGPVNIVR